MAYLGKTVNGRLHYGACPELFLLARELRKTMTTTEKIIWPELRNRSLAGIKFRRQHPVSRYIVDFFCLEKELVIEIDGGIHQVEEVKEKDDNRTAELERLGLTVLRFTNEEVINDIEGVMKRIEEFLTSPPGPLS